MSNPTSNQKTWLAKMAWRDGKASGKKLLLFMASIILGIGAVVAIQSFGYNLKQTISLQSKSLMGADFIIDTEKAAGEKVISLMDSLGGPEAREISFSSMAAFPGPGTTKLVQVRGIEKGFPFYGSLETVPAEAASAFRQKNQALVDATVMLQMNLQPGDSIKIGNKTLAIAGALESIPGSAGLFSSIAPPVVIPYRTIKKTGLLQTGSRIDYSYYFVTSGPTDMEALDEKLDPVLEEADADIDTHLSTAERLGRRYENFGKFLNLIAFIALLLGCIGIASAIHIYIREKLKAVAVLKCLGATKRQTFYIFLIQIAAMGLLGGIIGTASGFLLQQLFPMFLGDLIPVTVEVSMPPQTLLMGLLLGLFMSVLFALYPLAGTLYVSPLETLRIQEKPRGKSQRTGILILGLIFLFIFLFSLWLLEEWDYALSFVAGVLVTFSIIAATGHFLMRSVKRYFPKSWSFTARQSLLNLFRPQNQTLVLILSIGVGSFLISTLYFTRDLLLAQADPQAGGASPNMILLDIQQEQHKKVAALLQDRGLPVLGNIPIVTMRVQEINGRTVSEIREDTTGGINDWVLNHEFRVTYRDSLISSETLEEGTWVGRVTEDTAIPVSVSRDFAGDAQVEVGNELVFNVQGVMMNTVVRSIRTVDWARMHPNFSIVFPEGVLEAAPQFRVFTTRTPTAKASAEIQQALVSMFPNISILDLRQLLTVVQDILDKVAWLINFMAFFSILTGIIVLLGAVKTSKYQRLRENVLLRTIGARSSQILKITALEYLYLGIFGSLLGILLSLVGSQLLAWLVFDTGFEPSLIPFLVLFPGISILVLVIGLSNSRSVIKSPPLQVLRKELR